MPIRRSSLIAASLLLPSLAFISASCAEPEAEGPPPLSQAALDAIAEDAGAPKDQLARQIDELFATEGLGETRAVLVLKDGKLAAERYGEGYDEDTRFISWSMAKTVTAVLIGMLVADGLLGVDAPAPVELWQRTGDPRADITLRHLLQMRSGLRHTEAGDPPYDSSEVRMLFLDGRDDMARWARGQPLEAEPGEKFEYSSNTTVILADIAANTLSESDNPDARRKAVSDYLEERLFAPLGMTSIVPEFDASGTLIGGSLMHATAMDYARFGEFLRNGGQGPSGEQLVPSGWVDAMLEPSPTAQLYGYQIWLNRPDPDLGEQHPLFPDRAPATMFSLIGHMGQYVIVSPEQGLTVVRLGHSTSTQRPPMLQEVADVMALYPVEGE